MAGGYFDAFEDWERTRRHLSEGTIRCRRGALRGVEQGVGSLLEASTEDIERWLDGRRISASTRYAYTSHLTAFYRWAVRTGLRADNPALVMERPRLPKRLPRPVQEEELEHVLQVIAWRRPVRTWVLLGAYTGLRRAEIAGVRYEDINWSEPSLRVMGKGRKERVVPLHELVAKELQWYRIDGARGRLFEQSPDAVGHAVAKAMRGAGVDRSAHQLRHRFGTRVYQRTSDILVTADLMGHENIQTTRTYALVSSGQRLKAVSGL